MTTGLTTPGQKWGVECSEAAGCHQRPEIRGEAQRAKELSELCTYTPMHCLNIHIT